MGRFVSRNKFEHAHHWMFSAVSMMLAGAGALALLLNFPMSPQLQSAGVVVLVAAWVACWASVATASIVMFLSIVSLQLAALFAYGFDLAPLFAVIDAALFVLLWKKARGN